MKDLKQKKFEVGVIMVVEKRKVEEDVQRKSVEKEDVQRKSVEDVGSSLFPVRYSINKNIFEHF